MYGTTEKLLIAVAVTLILILPLLALWGLLRLLRRRALRRGHPGVGAYLRSTPRTDLEKRDAVDLALKGLVICMLGFLFPPLLLVGLVPFYYGSRKVCLAWLGLELAEELE